MNNESILYDKLKKALDSSIKKTNHMYVFTRTKWLLLISTISFLFFIFSSYKTLAALGILISQKSTHDSTYTLPQNKKDAIFVDVSGAVSKPQTYRVSSGTRLFQLLELAGGLGAEADKAFIQRNYNLSVILTDQQKIHFPTVFEVRDGLFIENRRLVTLESSSNQVQGTSIRAQETVSNSTKISINNASQLELESLPGIGPVTAQRIIAARPFSRLDDLLSQDLLKDSIYQEIIQQLEL